MAAKKATKKTTSRALTLKERDLKSLKLPKAVVDDPRKSRFLALYYDRESPTYGNMKQSALAAGFSAEYADNLSHLRPNWLSDFIGQTDIASLAEQHLIEVMQMPSITPAMGPFGPIEKTIVIEEETGEVYKSGPNKGKKKIKVPIMKENTALIKAKTEAAKIVLPAHDERYKKAAAPSNNFIFNMTEDRQKSA